MSLEVGKLDYPGAAILPPIKGSTTIDTATYPNGTPVSSVEKTVRSITFFNPVGNAAINLGTGVAGGNIATIPASPDGVLPGEYPLSQDNGFINLEDWYINGTNGQVLSWLALQ